MFAESISAISLSQYSHVFQSICRDVNLCTHTVQTMGILTFPMLFSSSFSSSPIVVIALIHCCLHSDKFVCLWPMLCAEYEIITEICTLALFALPPNQSHSNRWEMLRMPLPLIFHFAFINAHLSAHSIFYASLSSAHSIPFRSCSPASVLFVLILAFGWRHWCPVRCVCCCAHYVIYSHE